MFKCFYCNREYPDYYVPDPRHQRTNKPTCFECHLEERDNQRKPRHQYLPRPQPPQIYLTDRQYEAWKLVHVDGMSQKDVATQMGIAQQNVSKLIHRICKGVKTP